MLCVTAALMLGLQSQKSSTFCLGVQNEEEEGCVSRHNLGFAL